MFYRYPFMAIIYRPTNSIEQSRNRFKRSFRAAGVGYSVKLLTTGFFRIRWGSLGAVVYLFLL